MYLINSSQLHKRRLDLYRPDSNWLTWQKCKPRQIRLDHLKWLKNRKCRDLQACVESVLQWSYMLFGSHKKANMALGCYLQGNRGYILEVILTLHKDSTETSLSQPLTDSQRNLRQ